ncbi:MAG: HAD family hydrolase [Chitinophagaceae bacterium]
MALKSILFDMIGTTVMEKDSSIVNKCFVQAFKRYGINTTEDIIKANRGKDKKEVIVAIADEAGTSVEIDLIINAFESEFDKHLDNFYENNEARELFRWLKEKKIIIGLGTGLPETLFQRIYKHLGWTDLSFDYIGVAEQIGKGRPHPAMILDMLQKCNLDHSELIKVGDTVADIKEGKNAKVLTAALLSGTQSKEDILNEHPDFTINSLSELKSIIDW